MKEPIPQDWWNSETKQMETWIRNSETGRWEREPSVEERIDASPEPSDEEPIPQEWWNPETEQLEKWIRNPTGRWERIYDGEGVEVDANADVAGAEAICKDVDASKEDAESTSTADPSLETFLARVGPGFDAAFVSQHTGAEEYDDLITLTFTRQDLDCLVSAGMKPLLVNKLFRAIRNEPGWREQAHS